MLRSDPEHLRQLVAKVKKWILASYWKKGQWGALSVIKLKNKIIYRREALIVIQKSVSGSEKQVKPGFAKYQPRGSAKRI